MVNLKMENPTGKGTTYQQNGDKYVGNYRNGKKKWKGNLLFFKR